MSSLKDKVIFITGASRGIGLEIAKRAARDGACIAIAAKTAEPHRYLPGTIYTAAEEIEALGGRALPLVVDVRSEESVAAAVEKTVATFGGLDICINNASAINLVDTESVSMKSWDLMNQVNARGTFLTSKLCLPHLQRAANPHVLTLSPPLDMQAKWFARHVAYSMAKFGMSMVVLGMAAEFKRAGVAFNALWPRTPIATAAIEFGIEGGKALIARSRKPEIMADAAHCILTQPAASFSGNFCIDDTLLYELGGVTDFEPYRCVAGSDLATDFFVPDDATPPPGVHTTAF
ncbi:NAD(P)-dependent oxidoreductase [Pseudomaricurvus alcaniphilus]|uniref:SDR family oxidoreductase n=1 Tax=Pseudomaricurvus alcaniphilus TaxID=1166482 RepID=UPI0014091FE0|nr:NAD(P)-dependent oxidoreductase [Pseudomaricurvus alcaniphilus]NHN37984.1 NAD(P)-dependent oxidoreductase [Pseudomaricurvus alcaniphilus]